MGLSAVIILLVAFAAPSFQQWAGNQGSGGYIDGLVGGIGKGGSQGNCYDRCRDAYLINRVTAHVPRCDCSRYDFSNLGGRPVFPGNNNCNNDRDCPLGSYCQQDRLARGRLGRRGTCVPRNIPDRNPQIGGGHCGYLSPDCRVSGYVYNAADKWTFDYTLRRCVVVSVRPDCAYSYGISQNIFKTQIDCSRQCESNRSY